MWLGHAYRRAGELTAATGAYRRAALIEPDNPEVLMGLATLREAVGDRGGALAYYQRITSTAPSFAAAWRAAGESYMQSGYHPQAADNFERYLALVPTDSDIHYLYGVSLYFGGRHDEAVVALENAIEQFPDLVSVRYALGVVLADRPAEADRALEMLQAAVDGGFEQVEATSISSAASTLIAASTRSPSTHSRRPSPPTRNISTPTTDWPRHSRAPDDATRPGRSWLGSTSYGSSSTPMTTATSN